MFIIILNEISGWYDCRSMLYKNITIPSHILNLECIHQIFVKFRAL